MKISILVPYRPGGPDRRRLWSWVEARYRLLFPEAEMIVSADANGEDSTEPFNHPQAINMCADQATGDVLVVADSDTGFSLAPLMKACRIAYDKGDWFVPQTYHQLTEAATEHILACDPGQYEFEESPETSWTGHGSSVAPIVVLPAHAFHKVGGYDERYPGWGSDDRAFSIAMNTLWRPYKRWAGASYHLYHSRGDCAFDSNPKLTHRYIAAEGNVSLVQRLRRGHRLVLPSG